MFLRTTCVICLDAYKLDIIPDLHFINNNQLPTHKSWSGSATASSKPRRLGQTLVITEWHRFVNLHRLSVCIISSAFMNANTINSRLLTEKSRIPLPHRQQMVSLDATGKFSRLFSSFLQTYANILLTHKTAQVKKRT